MAAACCCLASCCCLLLLLQACKGLAAEAAPSGRREARSLRDCSACTTLPSKTKNFTGHRTQKAVSPQNLNFESKAADLHAVHDEGEVDAACCAAGSSFAAMRWRWPVLQSLLTGGRT